MYDSKILNQSKKYSGLDKAAVRENFLWNQISPFLEAAAGNPYLKKSELCQLAKIQPGKVDRIRKELEIDSVFRAGGDLAKKRQEKKKLQMKRNNALKHKEKTTSVPEIASEGKRIRKAKAGAERNQTTNQITENELSAMLEDRYS